MSHLCCAPAMHWSSSRALMDIVTMQVRVPVSHMLALDQAPAAFKALLSREAVGKVLLTVHGNAKM